MQNDLFFGENEDLDKSSVYLGMRILNVLEKSKKLTIYEVFDFLRGRYPDVNYSNVMNALVFLYLTDIVCFKKPYFELADDNA
jgi:hypothetical protein